MTGFGCEEASEGDLAYIADDDWLIGDDWLISDGWPRETCLTGYRDSRHVIAQPVTTDPVITDKRTVYSA